MCRCLREQKGFFLTKRNLILLCGYGNKIVSPGASACACTRACARACACACTRARACTRACAGARACGCANVCRDVRRFRLFKFVVDL